MEHLPRVALSNGLFTTFSGNVNVEKLAVLFQYDILAIFNTAKTNRKEMQSCAFFIKYHPINPALRAKRLFALQFYFLEIIIRIC